MKITINGIGKPLLQHIEDNINLFPKCLGRMGQPILYNIQDIPKDCVAPKNLTKEQDRAISLDEVLLLNRDNLDASKYCITTEGAEYIENSKKEFAKKYVDKLHKCSNCHVFDKCNVITTHTLKLVELDILHNSS